MYKFIVLGDANVGKTTFLHTWKYKMFTSDYISTIGIDLYVKVMEHENRNVKIYFWDTAGHERFKSITRLYLRALAGAIVMFDMSDRKSFRSVPQWVNMLRDDADTLPYLIVVANKCDLRRDVSTEEAQELAKQLNAKYYELDKNHPRIVHTIVQDMVANVPIENVDELQPIHLDTRQERTCCM